jgi:hypothetical protein
MEALASLLGVDLLVIWPLVLIVSFWCTIRAFR